MTEGCNFDVQYVAHGRILENSAESYAWVIVLVVASASMLVGLLFRTGTGPAEMSRFHTNDGPAMKKRRHELKIGYDIE